MSGIKLTYFNLKGRAELARLILAQAEVQYEDCRIERGDWAAMKKTLPLGQLPVMEVEGTTISQSMSIARYLARRFGLAGKNDVEGAEADQTVDAINDLTNSVVPVLNEKDEKKKAEMKKKVQTETMPNWLRMMERLLTSKGGNHFAGNQLTWADIAVYFFMETFKVRWMEHIGEPDLDNCPNLNKLLETVKNLPNIKKWEAARPDTPM
eukprot:GFUD01066215.1.p1 GENE.GFUD01066215.1~~GFUD01066215.1.p1  ORF type:complete len:209 (+),score=73.67 GFUD01066215.1:42-668(+)